MRWGCPHCETKLTIADEKLSSGWSFARCHRCNGHCLIRKAEANVIKVDRAPSGENILSPDLPEELISVSVAPKKAAPSPAASITVRGSAEPTFQAAQVLRSRSQRISPLVSVAIGIAGAMTVFSGIYLYLEGQDLWEKTHPLAQIAATTPKDVRVGVTKTEVVAPPPLMSRAPATVSAPIPLRKDSEVTDRVHQNAMAPRREAIVEHPHAGLLVQPRQDNVKLRSGPGLEYPIIGLGARELKYTVADWNGPWFRIRIPGSLQTAWIRNDLVQLTTQ